jgi:hypothetical protein
VWVDTDLILVLGLAVAALTFPAAVSAFSRGLPPRGATVAAVVGGVLIVLAVTQHPGGYNFEDVPHVMAKVADRYLN